MLAEADLSRLLLSLHATPLDESQWQSFLDQLSSLVHTTAGAVLSHDSEADAQKLLAFSSREVDSHFSKRYTEHYGVSDPYGEPFRHYARGQVIDADELVDRSRFTSSTFYNELMSPADMQFGTIIPAAGTGRIEAVTLWRNRRYGRMEGEELRLLEALLPHIQLAFQVRLSLQAACSVASLHLFLAANSERAFLLIGQRGEVAFASPRAERLLRQADGLRLSGQGICATARHVNGRLTGTIARCRAAERRGGALLVERPSGKPPLHVTVSPLILPGGDAVYRGHLLVCLHDPLDKPSPSQRTLEALFQLTTAESAIAIHLVQGLSPKEISERRRVSVGTVRSQLKSLFSKTNTRCQSELVLLLAGIAANG